MSSIDLLIVEDDPDERECYEHIAARYNLTAISFDSGLSALEYLRGLQDSDFPRAYLVDMRTGITDEELASPLVLFHFLREKNAIDNFRFHTGHFSKHDREVQDLTGAKVLLKADPETDEFLKKLKS